MQGSPTKLIGFMEGADKRYVIPVYQRKYDWKLDNCRQLYEDLKKIVTEGRNSHFFGSIVSDVVPCGSRIEYHIIDGQQRLTTVTLLLLAIRNLISNGKVKVDKNDLDEEITKRFLIAPWTSEDNKIKLRPAKSDKEALIKLFGDEEDYEQSSNLTLNYRFFCDLLLKEEIPVQDLYNAIGKLVIISITLEAGDNAQRIFESLNSTGLALTEGDKIRNYVLMSLPASEQTKYYDTYWAKIEKCTENDVSGFVRDYLSIKQQITPNINSVYKAFKSYADNLPISVDELLTDLLKYARFYEKLLTCNSGLKNQKLDDCLYRMKRLEIVVTRPFLLEVFRLQQDGKLTTDEVLQIFLITENYLFRRNICDVPTNALNKVFLNLNKEIIRYDNTTDNYVEKFKYALLSKKESSRFPDDKEFRTVLSEKQIYQMRGKYKAYLFERFENYGTVETKDVFTHLDNSIYTIEHIMPQHLTPAWYESLGEKATEIHETWLHRLANLTLTGYNPTLSNKTFIEKRDSETGGYRVSGLKMNQKISMLDSWGLKELEERNTDMLNQAMKIWFFPETNYVPPVKEYDSCTLDDENYDLTGRDIAKYNYLSIEQPATSWADMFEHVVKYLHQKDKSVLVTLAYDKNENKDLVSYVSNREADLRNPLKIDESLYIEKNTSTAMKMSILRRLFPLYKADPMDLVFYLKDPETRKTSDENRETIRRRYWEYALPIIQEKHTKRGCFSGCTPTSSNAAAGFFGLRGFCIRCVANYDNARVEFYLGNSSTEKNKETFDLLYRHKAEVESKLKATLCWERADEHKASWISYKIGDISIANEADWPRMARFHAEWSDKLCDALLCYLQTEEDRRTEDIMTLLKEWVQTQKNAHLDVNRSTRTYTRFTTEGMSTVLPDIPNAPSGWNTDNHYFYEIINRDNKAVQIQFAISSKNITDDFRILCDRINQNYPSKADSQTWQWRTHFKTSSFELGEELNKEMIFSHLDSCMQEILAFEAALIEKLNS